IHVSPANSGEARVEPRWRGTNVDHTHVVRKRPIEPVTQPRDIHRRQIGVRDLAGGVHARIGPTRDGQPHRLRHPQHLLRGFLQDPLHGPPARLLRPAGEVRAVVGDVPAQTDEPATFVLGGGLIGKLRSNQDSPSLSLDSSEASSAASSEASSAASSEASSEASALVSSASVALASSALVSSAASAASAALASSAGLVSAFADFFAARLVAFSASEVTVFSATSSITAIGALSPLRGTVLVIRT